MGELKPVRPVKLFCGILYREEAVIEETFGTLERRYGAFDSRSAPIPFTATDYYTAEMGNPLHRIFISFANLIHPADLPEIKLGTNKIENELRVWRELSSRPVNLDPGYLSASKIVLASTKNYAHRIFLRDGIYGEIEFFFKRQGIQCLDWTYPDYRTEPYHLIFLKIRQIYLRQMKHWTPQS